VRGGHKNFRSATRTELSKLREFGERGVKSSLPKLAFLSLLPHFRQKGKAFVSRGEQLCAIIWFCFRKTAFVQVTP